MFVEHGTYAQGPEKKDDYRKLDTLVAEYQKRLADPKSDEKQNRKLFESIYVHCQNFLFKKAILNLRKYPSLKETYEDSSDLVHEFFASKRFISCLKDWKTEEEMKNIPNSRHGKFITYLGAIFHYFIISHFDKSGAKKRKAYRAARHEPTDVDGNLLRENNFGQALSDIKPGAIQDEFLSKIYQDSVRDALKQWIQNATIEDLDTIYIGLQRFDFGKVYLDLWKGAVKKCLDKGDVAGKKKAEYPDYLRKIIAVGNPEHNDTNKMYTSQQLARFFGVVPQLARQKEKKFIQKLKTSIEASKQDSSNNDN